MDELSPGLYEALVTEGLRRRMRAVPTEHVVITGLAPGDAADRIAAHLAREIERALRDVPDDERARRGVEIARALLDRLAEFAPVPDDAVPVPPGRVLQAVLPVMPDGLPGRIDPPLTPLRDTTLLTNAPGEPNLWSQLRSEIASADGIDVVMAFIRRSGIAPLLDALRRHREAGRPLRILTTTYTGSTERRALDQLRDLGADVRVSYDVGTTRLHAKAWIFHRRGGLTTAYVGSSNLTHSAQVTGLEWNVRTSAARNVDVVAKFAAVFDSYWQSGDFVEYEPDRFDAETARAARPGWGPDVVLSPIEVRPLPFQERLLELLDLARRRGHHRNLLVAATGTGKTVMAALDYARLRESLPGSRLLFVAHREEILDQSLATFRHVLRDPVFGEKWVAGRRPRRFAHVFASIQTLSANGLEALAGDHFDVVIVDEFHHAAARSYERVLERLTPAELLGLTATPERSDGLPVLQWFGDRIAAELRLWDAIDQQHLVPFMYFGVHDGMDLTRIPWRRGRGYDTDALTNLYTADDAWARGVIREVVRHAEPERMRALGFCVSVAHARFMARHFSRHGIPAVAVSGRSSEGDRRDALRDLRAGTVRIVFSVDLFNEGVDVPSVDTLLLLRPTESPTLFIQQLGRGLRRAPGKAHCTVLDFVGVHRTEFRFDRRLRALLGGSRSEVTRAVSAGFPFLPAGCTMQLDRTAEDVILESLRRAIPSRWPEKVDELRGLARRRSETSLAAFLAESGLDLDDIYDGNRCWSDLREAAGLATRPAGPHEGALRRAIGRLLHVDDEERIAIYERHLPASRPPALDTRAVRERRALHMLVAGVANEALTKSVHLDDALALLWMHPQVRAELIDLLEVLRERVSHVHVPLATHPDAPLQVHARYSRLEILAAMGVPQRARVAPWQTGVLEAKEARAELLAFTLDKSTGGFSPTTRYRDYALSRTLIHWESQSTTREHGPAGRRYRNHVRDDRSILLFARLRTTDRAFWFLGPATYRGHVGELPMAITRELAHPLPGDLYARFAAAVA